MPSSSILHFLLMFISDTFWQKKITIPVKSRFSILTSHVCATIRARYPLMSICVISVVTGCFDAVYVDSFPTLRAFPNRVTTRRGISVNFHPRSRLPLRLCGWKFCHSFIRLFNFPCVPTLRVFYRIQCRLSVNQVTHPLPSLPVPMTYSKNRSAPKCREGCSNNAACRSNRKAGRHGLPSAPPSPYSMPLWLRLRSHKMRFQSYNSHIVVTYES